LAVLVALVLVSMLLAMLALVVLESDVGLGGSWLGY